MSRTLFLLIIQIGNIDMRYLLLTAFAACLCACASNSKDIRADYVSPLQYKDYDCDQLTAEGTRVSRKALELGGDVDRRANGDKVKMGVGLVLFWPTLFFLKGNGPEAQEYARLQGERDAIEEAYIQKKCAMEPKVAPVSTAAPAANR
jgi:hypothetical protein